jgi:hypothetical protein
MASTRRISLTLDVPDQQAIEPFVDPSRPEHAALEAWAAQHGITLRDESDAAIIRTLVRAGAEALLEKALEDGYARLAVSRHRDDQAERRAIRDRALNRAGEGSAE